MKRFTISGGDFRALRKFATDRGGMTLYILVMAVLGRALHVWTGQTRFFVVSPVANRSEPNGIEDVAGPVMNLMLVPFDFGTGQDTERYLAGVAECITGCYEHQGIPITEILDAIGVTADNPIDFPVFCTHEYKRGSVTRGSGLTVKQVPIGRNRTNIKIHVYATETPSSLNIMLVYAREIAPEEEVTKLLKLIRSGLEQLAGRRPSRQLSSRLTNTSELRMAAVHMADPASAQEP